MAKVTIGGQEYEVPELNFTALELAWPYVEESMTTLDPMKGPAAGIRIIAAGLMEADNFRPEDFGIKPEESLGEEQTFDRITLFLKKKLKATEIEQVRRCVENICEEAGLEQASPGELQPPEADPSQENPSEETAASSSPSSSPQGAREEVG